MSDLIPEGEIDTAQAAKELNVTPRRVLQFIKAGRLIATYHAVPNCPGYWTMTPAALDAVRNRPNGRPRKIRAEDG